MVPRSTFVAAFMLAASSLAGEAAPGTRGLRTDRLSRKHLQVWNRIVEIVMADDRDGRPLHPALRQLWDAVDTSGHVVYVEMSDRKSSTTAGRFVVTNVDPEGKAHEAILVMNLRAIDNVSTKPGTTRAGGFIPFKGLGKNERYAELLGHELAHAVWHLADTERARLAQRLKSESERWMQMMLAERDRRLGPELQERGEELARLKRELEEQAEAAEEAIWEELKRGRRTP